jgi:hypothetical protein
MPDHLLEQVVETFWRWDPIGMGADREIAYSEYDTVAARVNGAVRQRRGRDIEATEATARKFVTEDLEISDLGIDDFMAEIRRIASSR